MRRTFCFAFGFLHGWRGGGGVRIEGKRANGRFGGGAVLACRCDECAYLRYRTVLLRYVTPPGAFPKSFNLYPGCVCSCCSVVYAVLVDVRKLAYFRCQLFSSLEVTSRYEARRSSSDATRAATTRRDMCAKASSGTRCSQSTTAKVCSLVGVAIYRSSMLKKDLGTFDIAMASSKVQRLTPV